MYLRHTTIEKEGKRHTYWRLVRAVRMGKKVRQQTVTRLGELDTEGRVQARSLWQPITGASGSPLDFFAAASAAPVAVRLQGVRLEQGAGSVTYGWVGRCGER
jgi:hypothetical protein